MKARSDAWAARRVVDVVNSLPTQVFTRCSLNEYLAQTPEWRGSVRRALSEPKVTVAVIDLMDLAQRGGLLDELSGVGFVIKGPIWK